MWPLWHCMIGGNAQSKQTGHSNSDAKSDDDPEMPFDVANYQQQKHVTHITQKFIYGILYIDSKLTSTSTADVS